ncbi:hypothetical protein [Thermopetrobacter sp. TC1]|uniref:hypothetical protein n=1 Tax=Thermopetrobacter sp. TC1 TaxID=1495045 RepID=UPI0012E03743|nr:hypothetical protein [Thermopetrobacter sp. TC1]
MTKKMLKSVLHDGDKWQYEQSWLMPLWAEDGIIFVTVPGAKPRQFGMVVYTGVELSPMDLLERMEEKGIQVLNSDKQLYVLSEFLRLIPNFRIGDIVRCTYKGGSLQLEKEISLAARAQRNPLP